MAATPTRRRYLPGQVALAEIAQQDGRLGGGGGSRFARVARTPLRGKKRVRLRAARCRSPEMGCVGGVGAHRAGLGRAMSGTGQSWTPPYTHRGHPLRDLRPIPDYLQRILQVARSSLPQRGRWRAVCQSSRRRRQGLIDCRGLSGGGGTVDCGGRRSRRWQAPSPPAAMAAVTASDGRRGGGEFVGGRGARVGTEVSYRRAARHGGGLDVTGGEGEMGATLGAKDEPGLDTHTTYGHCTV